MKIEEYKLVLRQQPDGLSQLEISVNEMIREGWEPLGAPFDCVRHGSGLFVQAMVKRAEIEFVHTGPK